MRKKTVFVCLIIYLVILTFVTGCQFSDEAKIDQIVQHLRAGELDAALEKCCTMDDVTLEAGREDILDEVIGNLEDIRKSDWLLTKYELVDVDTIEVLKKYKEILSYLKVEEVFTNADEFVNKALEMEQFIEWNDYYAADGDYIEDINYYVDLAEESSYWSVAVMYLEEAYDIADKASREYSGEKGKGMVEAYEFYTSYKVMIGNWIDGVDSTSKQKSTFESARKTMVKLLEEYITVYEKAEEIFKAFPSELY